MKPRSRAIGCYHDRIALKLDRHLGSAAADVPVKFQAIEKIQTRISRLRDFTIACGKASYRLVNRGPEYFEYILCSIDTNEPGLHSRVIYS